ncbi:putative Histone RNA hairpin-binding protein RNA-binding domain containing protein [Leishmania shawi]|uniref:Histone RNA hairpin-binding protein RNA-binding domain containing protein n=1 Tax=Leishmania shawi TaxID=5680 RepID=A0AAW3BRM5_9TRYP
MHEANVSGNTHRNTSPSSVAPPVAEATPAAASQARGAFVSRGHDAARQDYCAAAIDHVNIALIASAVAPPFSWSPKPCATNHGMFADAAARDAKAALSTRTTTQDSTGEVSTTPDTHQRSRHMASPSQHPGDSSLVFVMSEDSELKVLASGVSPPTALPSAACTSSSSAIHPPLPHPSQSTVNRNQAARSHVPLGVDTGDGGVYAVNRRGSQHNRHGITGATLTGYNPVTGTGHLMPHTPGVRRETNIDAILSSCLQEAATRKPSVQLSQQLGGNARSAAATTAGALSSTGAAAPSAYHTTPHEPRAPPALQIFPGLGPGSHKVREPTATTTAPAAAVAPIAPLHTGFGTRWPQRHIPSASLYSAGSGEGAGAAACVYGTTRTSSSAAALHANVGGDKLAQQQQPPYAGASNSADARSQHSGTPLPPASQPLDKNFTEAQRLAALEEVQQELYLNYTAVPVPDNMINSGDTDERRRRLDQRRKQIIYGKETEGYLKYTSLISRPCDREYHNPLHAITPRPEYDCSKRQFDRVLNAWRRQLHQWDDYDMDNIDERFLPLGKASLLDLGLCHPPSSCTPTNATAGPPAGVMHSIANVAAMANGVLGDDDAMQCHSRSPIFTENSPTSGLYSSVSLSMHISSGRAASMAAACTPSRPQLSEGAEGPKVDESFFLHMNSGNSRIASPFHHTYSGTGHGGGNGRSSANSHYQQLMMRNSTAYAHNSANGGTPGSSYGNYTGLTPVHRPASRGGMPHHITAIFGSQYELMTPSGLASPAGIAHNPRTGSSPYPVGEPWMSSRRSPTCAVGTAHGVGGHHPSTVTLNGMAGTNSSETATMVSGRPGESPPNATALALIQSTSLGNSSSFAPSSYNYLAHSPAQPQAAPPQATIAYPTPLTHQQSRPGLSGYTNVTPATAGIHHPQRQSNSPSGTRFEPPQQQRQQLAIGTSTPGGGE